LKEVKIVFEEEKKVNDAGGLLREFVYLICQDIFKVERGIFSNWLMIKYKKRIIFKG